MDNVRCHHAKTVTEVLRDNRIKYKFLPAYSPQLSPIEEVFSVIKSRLSNKRPKAENKNQLKKDIENIIEEINDDLDFSGFYVHCRKYINMGYTRQFF